MGRNYKFLEDLTSDVMYEAYGSTMEEVFANAAEALFSVVCRVKEVAGDTEAVVQVDGKDEKELLYQWLSELLSQSEIQNIFFSKFEIQKLKKEGDVWYLEGKGIGEPASPEKGETLVKAVTYYGLDLKKAADGYTATVSLDI